MHGELVFALLVQKTLGGMYFEMHKQFISQRAGCEHTDDHREVGWGTRKHFNFLAGVDSGVPVRKLMRYHVVFCAKSSLT